MASGPATILIFHQRVSSSWFLVLGSWNLAPDTSDAAACASLLPRYPECRDQVSEPAPAQAGDQN